MNNVIVVLLFNFFLGVNVLMAENLRAPLDFFELLPIESQWLICGEGQICLDHRGQFKFSTKAKDNGSIREVDIFCFSDSIHIDEVQNGDTNSVWIVFPESGVMSFCFSNSGSRPNGVFRAKMDRDAFFYEEELFFYYVRDSWIRQSLDVCQRNVFGSNRLYNAIYKGIIIEDRRSVFGFVRSVVIDENSIQWVSERKRIFYLCLSNSYGCQWSRSRNAIRIVRPAINLKIRRPPKMTVLFEVSLILTVEDGHINLTDELFAS